MNTTIAAYIKIALAMLIVGSSVVIGKLIISSFPVFLAAELRFLIATIILIPLIIKVEGKLPTIQPKYLFYLFIQALTGVFLFNIFMLYGLKYTTAIEAGIITSTLPAVVAFISFLFLKEKLTVKQGVGIVLAVVGVLFMNGMGEQSGSSSSLIGNLLIFGAVIGETLFIVMGKSVSDKVTPLQITTMMSVFGLLLFLPFSIYEAMDFDFSAVGIIDWVNILYFGVVVTVVAFLLMYQGLSKVSASSAGIYTSVLPVSSVLLSYVILKEEILFAHIIGMLFVLLAIFLHSKGREELASNPTISENI